MQTFNFCNQKDSWFSKRMHGNQDYHGQLLAKEIPISYLFVFSLCLLLTLEFNTKYIYHHRVKRTETLYIEHHVHSKGATDRKGVQVCYRRFPHRLIYFCSRSKIIHHRNSLLSITQNLRENTLNTQVKQVKIHSSGTY